MTIIDPGHQYRLDCYDGGDPIYLQFMKRMGKGYPGNTSTYPGTNIQEVLRALIDRVKYLDQQVPDRRNLKVISHLRSSLGCLEDRAAERHGVELYPIEMEIELMQTCKTCGHIKCHHRGA